VMDSAQKIGDQVERCRRITHDLLKFSRKVETEQVPTDVNALLGDMVQMIQHRARAENIAFETDLQGVPPLLTSPSKIQQILVNLLNNAVDSMEGRGGTIFLSTRVRGRAMKVTLRDTGCGIPPENLSRIFEPFFTTKPVGKGTGLGLAVCYGLAHQMGGDLEVESRVGEGTTFTLTIPLSPPSEGR
ncbi:MAG: HAMP domain-containing sensor histidine kinase, partial [Acidobacteriota bacterium]